MAKIAYPVFRQNGRPVLDSLDLLIRAGGEIRIEALLDHLAARGGEKVEFFIHLCASAGKESRRPHSRS